MSRYPSTSNSGLEDKSNSFYLLFDALLRSFDLQIKFGSFTFRTPSYSISSSATTSIHSADILELSNLNFQPYDSHTNFHPTYNSSTSPQIRYVKMAPPPAKKPKTDPKAPIISKSSGFKPDIYFKVFDQESHVTSMVLKLTSGFFRTFLDPTGGKLSKSTKPAFTSEWFTKVDDDGSWALSSDHKVCN